MKTIYTRHALARMRQRDISEEEVESTIDYPSCGVEENRDGSTSYFSQVGDKLIEVVVIKKSSCCIIKSAIDIK